MVLWVMTRPGVADDLLLTKALYYVSFGFGGFGYSVPLALLMAGVSVPALFYRLVPKWMAILGLVVAGFGVLSWLSLEFTAGDVLHSADAVSGVRVDDRGGVCLAERCTPRRCAGLKLHLR